MPDYDIYLQLKAKVCLLEYLCAFLAAKIAVPVVAQLENDNGILRVHVPAANGVLLYHDANIVFPLFI